MSRGGFQIERLREAGLDSPGVTPMPAVSTANGPANQVRRILALAGQTAHTVAAFNERASAAEDRQNEGVASLEAGKVLPSMQEELSQSVLDTVMGGTNLDDEALDQMIEARVSGPLGELGLNEAGEQRFRQLIVGRLKSQAVAARSEAQTKIRTDAIVDASQAFAGASSPEQFDGVVQGLREIDPNLTDTDIERLALPALRAAAKTADRAAFEVIAGKMGDSPEVREARWTLDRTERQLRAEQDAAAKDEAQEAVSSFINDGNFAGARAVVKASGAFSESDKTQLLDDIGRRQDARHAEQTKIELEGLGNDLYELAANGDTEGYGKAVEDAIASGLVSKSDIPSLNGAFASQLTVRLEKEAQVAINDMLSATTEDEVAAAYGRVENAMRAADTALRRDSGEFGSLTQNQYQNVRRIIEPAVTQMKDAELRRGAVNKAIAQSETPEGFDFESLNGIRLASGSLDGAEIGREVADIKWQTLQETDPENALPQMVDWLARNRGAKWSQLERRYSGFIGRVAGALSNPDQPGRLAAVKDDISHLASIYQANPGVARDHVPAKIGDMLDVVVLMGDIIPTDDDSLLAAALNRITTLDGPIPPRELTNDDRKMIDKALARAGFDGGVENVEAMRREAYAKAKSLGSVFDGNMDRIAKRLGESYAANWAKSDGWAIQIADAKLGQSFDYSVVSKAVRRVHNQPDTVLKQHFDGTFRLFDKTNMITPADDSPVLSGDDMRRLSSFYGDFSSRVRNDLGMRKLMDERTAKQKRDDQYARYLETLTDREQIDGDNMAPDGFASWQLLSSAVGSMYQSGQMEGMHGAYVNRLIELNSREADPYEKELLEMFKTLDREEIAESGRRVRESTDVPESTRIFLRP